MARDTRNQALFSKIHVILNDEQPSKEALYELLRHTSPNLKMEDVSDEPTRGAAVADLFFHVSKFKFEPPSPNSNRTQSSATQLSSAALQEFIDRCCERMLDKHKATGKRKASTALVQSSTTQVVPHSDLLGTFHVHNKWPFLDIHALHPHSQEHIRNLDPSVIVALHCLNARGTIVHGKPIEVPLTWNHEQGQDNMPSVAHIFDKLGGGVMRLNSINDIQRELINHGPVVSTCFLPGYLLPMANHPVAMIRSTTTTKHPVLIVGWGRSSFNRYWIAKRIPHGRGSTAEENNASTTMSLKIGFGQFSIDDECIAPKRSLQDVTWQHGRAFDVSGMAQGWMEGPTLTIRVSTADQNRLMTRYRVGASEPLVIRDKHIHAHLRRYEFVATNLVKESNEWKMVFERIE